jgi:hypothetical protein
MFRLFILYKKPFLNVINHGYAVVSLCAVAYMAACVLLVRRVCVLVERRRSTPQLPSPHSSNTQLQCVLNEIK